MFGAITLFPLYMQTAPAAGYGFGLSVTQTGIAMLPVAVPMLVVVPLAARLGVRAGSALPLAIGAACATVAYAAIAIAHDHLWYFCVAGLLIGAGYGLAFAAIGNLVVNAVEPRHTGAATGVNTIVRTAGAAVGAQAAAALLAAYTSTGTRTPAESGYVVAFLTFASIAALAIPIARAIPTTPSNGPQPRQ